MAQPTEVRLELHSYKVGTDEPAPMPWPPLYSPLTKYLQPGDGVLDLGACVGQMARTFAHAVGPKGCVLAIEASPITAMMGRMLCSTYPNIHMVPLAVADRCGLAVLSLDADNLRRNSLWRANLTNDSPNTLLTAALTLDLIAATVPNLKAIKVDVQGAEGAMLEGASKTLQRTDLTWCVELWSQGFVNAGYSVKYVAEYFSEYGWYPVGDTWEGVLVKADEKPEGTQDVILQHKGRT